MMRSHLFKFMLGMLAFAVIGCGGGGTGTVFIVLPATTPPTVSQPTTPTVTFPSIPYVRATTERISSDPPFVMKEEIAPGLQRVVVSADRPKNKEFDYTFTLVDPETQRSMSNTLRTSDTFAELILPYGISYELSIRGILKASNREEDFPPGFTVTAQRGHQIWVDLYWIDDLYPGCGGIHSGGNLIGDILHQDAPGTPFTIRNNIIPRCDPYYALATAVPPGDYEFNIALGEGGASMVFAHEYYPDELLIGVNGVGPGVRDSSPSANKNGHLLINIWKSLPAVASPIEHRTKSGRAKTLFFHMSDDGIVSAPADPNTTRVPAPALASRRSDGGVEGFDQPINAKLEYEVSPGIFRARVAGSRFRNPTTRSYRFSIDRAGGGARATLVTTLPIVTAFIPTDALYSVWMERFTTANPLPTDVGPLEALSVLANPGVPISINFTETVTNSAPVAQIGPEVIGDFYAFAGFSRPLTFTPTGYWMSFQGYQYGHRTWSLATAAVPSYQPHHVNILFRPDLTSTQGWIYGSELAEQRKAAVDVYGATLKLVPGPIVPPSKDFAFSINPLNGHIQ